MSGVAVLVVAAGKGERAGGAVPKQYAPLLGKPILRWTLEAFARHPRVTSIQVAIGPDQQQLYAAAVEGLDLLPPVIGGATRQESVRRGLEALANAAPDMVLIQDAARPLVSNRVIDGVIAALEGGADGAVPLLAVADTLRSGTMAASGRPCRAKDCSARRRHRAFASQRSFARIVTMRPRTSRTTWRWPSLRVCISPPLRAKTET